MEYWQKLRQALGRQPLILSGAAGAIVREGKILLVRHKALQQWQIPGGLQELGESVQQTAERELKEELNLNLKAGPLISIYSHPKWNFEFPNGDAVQQLIFFFQMEGTFSNIHPLSSEVTDYRFFAPDEIPADTLPCCQQKVIDWTQYRGEVFLR